MKHTVQKRHAHKIWFVFNSRCEIISSHPTRKEALAAAAELEAASRSAETSDAKPKTIRELLDEDQVYQRAYDTKEQVPEGEK